MAVGVSVSYNVSLMEISLHSVTFHDCPVQHREKVSFTEDQRRNMLRALLDSPGIGEAAILQTCNRSEIYLYAKKNINWAKSISEVIKQVNPGAVQICEVLQASSGYRRGEAFV